MGQKKREGKTFLKVYKKMAGELRLFVEEPEVVRFSLAQVESKTKELLKKIPEGTEEVKKSIETLSMHQRGQMLTYLFYEFYKMPPNERRETDRGKNIFSVAGLLYADSNNDEFGEGLADLEMEQELIAKEGMDYEEFLKFWVSEFPEYQQNEIDAGREPDSLINHMLKEGKLEDIPKKKLLLEMVSDKTINDFIKNTEIPGVDIHASREDKLLELLDRFNRLFKVDDVESRRLMRAVLYEYSRLKGEDRKLFSEFLFEKTTDIRMEVKSLWMDTTLGSEGVHKLFSSWKYERKKKEEDEKREEDKILKRTPSFIRKNAFKFFTEAFDKNPTGEGLELIIKRFKFIEARRKFLEGKSDEESKKEMATIQEEEKFLGEWLKNFDLDGGAYDQLIEIENGLVAVQTAYYSMTSETPQAVRLLASIDDKPKLFNLYKKFIFSIDEKTAKIFDGISVDSEDLLVKMRNATISRLNPDVVSNGQSFWAENYYPGIIPFAEKLIEENPAEARMYNDAAQLHPLLSAAFYDYYKTVQATSVSSPEEKLLIANSLARLNFIARNPLLGVKFLSAMRHLAKVCEGNPAIYQQALLRVAARIDGHTKGLFDRTSPNQVTITNVRGIINKLSFGFNSILDIDETFLSRYGRYQLLGKYIKMRENAPFELRQRQPPWKPQMLLDEERAGSGFFPSYFLPQYMLNPPMMTPFSTGGVANYIGEGRLVLPNVSVFNMPTRAGAVGTAMKNYLYESHPPLGVTGAVFPTYLSGVNSHGLMKELEKAFISPVPANYSAEPIGGGAALGLRGTKTLEGQETTEEGETRARYSKDWVAGGAGFGSLITPSGGWSLGGAGEKGGRIMAGLTAIAFPIASIKEGKGQWSIESLVGGYEQLDDESKRWLVQSLQSVWDPENPSEHIIAINGEESSEEQRWMSARYFYVNKEGLISELQGGMSDFVRALNFLAGQLDGDVLTPSTYLMNYEPLLETGGGAIALDIGKSALLAHAQLVPFMNDEENQPMLIEWTPAYAQTVDTAEGVLLDVEVEVADASKLRELEEILEKMPGVVGAKITTKGEKATVQVFVELEGKKRDRLKKVKSVIEKASYIDVESMKERDENSVRIYETSLPGKMLYLSRDLPIGEKTEEERYVIQDANFMIREVQGMDAWELTLGAGLGTAPTIKTTEGGGRVVTSETELMGRGGVFLKTRQATSQWGVGAYYEAGSTNLEQLALVRESEETSNYIRSLHRLGVTVYGSGEVSTKFVLGGLGYLVPQLIEREKGVEYDNMLFRFIGFLKGMESMGKVDISRITGLDRIVSDYNTMSSQIGRDPQNASSYIENFAEKYRENVTRVFDNYYLGIRIKNDFSIETNIVTREKEADWTSQDLEKFYAKTLYTWRTGFIRAYASLPVWAPFGLLEQQERGVVAAGFGQDVLDGFWLQRVAIDAGLILALDQAGVEPYSSALSLEIPELRRSDLEMLKKQVPELTFLNDEEKTKKYGSTGWFAQIGVKLFSNVLDDSNAYRNLVRNYEKYLKAVGDSKFSTIPAEVRESMCGKLEGANVDISSAIIEKIRKGDRVPGLTKSQATAVSEALYIWFYNEKSVLQDKFDGHMRAFLGGSLYSIDEKYHADIAAFVEYVDKMKAYAIAAKREKWQLHTGAEIKILPEVVGGAFVDVALTGEEQYGAGMSLRYKLPVGEVGVLFQIRTENPPAYRNPVYAPYERQGVPEFTAVIFYNLFETGIPPVPSGTGIVPTRPGELGRERW